LQNFSFNTQKILISQWLFKPRGRGYLFIYKHLIIINL
jgi:hypothetical protein